MKPLVTGQSCESTNFCWHATYCRPRTGSDRSSRPRRVGLDLADQVGRAASPVDDQQRADKGSQPPERRHQRWRPGARCLAGTTRAGGRGGPAARGYAITGSAASWARRSPARPPGTTPGSSRPASGAQDQGPARTDGSARRSGRVGVLWFFGIGGQIGRPSRARRKGRAGDQQHQTAHLHPKTAGRGG
jgi:hypothetical protein